MAEVEMKRMGPELVASLPVVGTYREFSMHLDRLAAWLRERGVEPAGPAVGVFWSAPGGDGEGPGRARYEVQMPVQAELAGSQGVEVKVVPMRDYATLLYPGPVTPHETARAYQRILEWAARRGLEPSGPPREVYLGRPEDLRRGELAAELQVPVRPAEARRGRARLQEELAPESSVLGRVGGGAG
ncbi:MAG: GyrI-like domain-containing protein [Acetobacteraceae bacterium]|nr:GyrI-like domain-containing protein [Acetobacteraceae bacterium]